MFDVNPITSPKEVDCGATCLAMLLDYYKKPWNLDELIVECHTRINGCTAKDVLRVGRDHGLDMTAFETDVDGVVNADRPSIIWWKFNHFCVCCGTDENGQVVICNPDKGRYRMSKGTFASFYSGIALFNGTPKDL